MQRQLIRDVAHNPPVPVLAHLPSRANRPDQCGGGSEVGGDWHNGLPGLCFLPPAAGGILRMEKPQVCMEDAGLDCGSGIRNQEWAFWLALVVSLAMKCCLTSMIWVVGVWGDEGGPSEHVSSHWV